MHPVPTPCLGVLLPGEAVGDHPVQAQEEAAAQAAQVLAEVVVGGALVEGAAVLVARPARPGLRGLLEARLARLDLLGVPVARLDRLQEEEAHREGGGPAQEGDLLQAADAAVSDLSVSSDTLTIRKQASFCPLLGSVIVFNCRSTQILTLPSARL